MDDWGHFSVIHTLQSWLWCNNITLPAFVLLSYTPPISTFKYILKVVSVQQVSWIFWLTNGTLYQEQRPMQTLYFYFIKNRSIPTFTNAAVRKM